MALPDIVNETVVVVPVYNHAATLRQVVDCVLKHHDRVLVVDDGSTDGGIDTVKDLSIDILQHAGNRGKGAALKSAAQWGLERGMSHMISLDADGQHDPDDLPEFLAAIAETPQALIVGHRNFDQESIPGSSRFGRQFSNFWLRLQTGSQLKDTQSGFRAYPLLIFERLNFWTNRYNFEIEVLVRSVWAGLELRDIDISVYYPPGEERVSHFRGFMDNWRLTMLNTHFTLRSIVPWPHKKIIEGSNPQGTKLVPLSMLRPMRSIRVLSQENSSPIRLAAAAAVGVLLGTLPLIACHTIAILLVCGFFRLNKVAAVSSSQLCMPPVVPALCVEVGFYLRHGRWLTDFSIETLGYQALERIYEWFLGSLLLAPLMAMLVALLTYLMAQMVQKKDAERV